MLYKLIYILIKNEQINCIILFTFKKFVIGASVCIYTLVINFIDDVVLYK